MHWKTIVLYLEFDPGQGFQCLHTHAVTWPLSGEIVNGGLTCGGQIE